MIEDEIRDIKIREANVWDAYRITELWSKMQEEIKPINREYSIREQEIFLLSLFVKIKNGWHSVVVAERDGTIIGFITTSLRYYELAPDRLVGVCDNLYILPEHRGGKTSDRLLEYVINYGKSYKMKEMEFITVYDERLVKIWQRKGFRPAQVTYMKEV